MPTGLVFRYEAKDGAHEIYVGGLGTAEGLDVFPPSAAVRVTRFGATSYARYGWATENELPPFGSVAELRTFLEKDIGLVEIAVEVVPGGALSSHDDGECHFVLADRAAAISALRRYVPAAFEGRVIHAVLATPGHYVTCSEAGVIAKYPTFDAYLAAEGGSPRHAT